MEYKQKKALIGATIACLIAGLIVNEAEKRYWRDKPHKVVTRLGPQILSEIWTTNRTRYSYEAEMTWRDGHVTTNWVRKTNYLW